jgi:hypothetical protein
VAKLKEDNHQEWCSKVQGEQPLGRRWQNSRRTTTRKKTTKGRMRAAEFKEEDHEEMDNQD